MALFNWGKPKSFADAGIDTNFKPLPDDELKLIRSYAEHLIKTGSASLSGFGYNPGTVKYLSDDLDAGRERYAGEQKVKIANIYGAFLGCAIEASFPHYEPRWVTSDDGVGLELGRSPLQKVAFPITRVFKQIELGPEYSIYDYFLAIPKFVEEDARKA